MDNKASQPTKIKKINSQHQAAKLALEKRRAATQDIIRQQLNAIFNDTSGSDTKNSKASKKPLVAPTVDDIWQEQRRQKLEQQQENQKAKIIDSHTTQTLLKTVEAEQPESPSATPPRPKSDSKEKIIPSSSINQNQPPAKTNDRPSNNPTLANATPKSGGWQQAGDNQKQASTTPYQQTYNQQPANKNYDWKKYHAAWQDYYKKYYEYYYQQALNSSPKVTPEPKADDQSPVKDQVFNPQDQALDDLRQQLRQKMQTSVKKAKASRHFWPIVSAISVVVIFMLLQYNRLIMANIYAYVSPGTVTTESIVVDPQATLNVGPEPKLIIPKINVDVPVAYDIANDDASTMKAMENGVAHFSIPGANAHPGEVGNTVISGHSSNEVFDQGDYKFIFAKLTELKKDDVIYADYKGKRYTYKVTKSEEVLPTDVHKLIYDTDKPVLTLITCVPLGTAHRRLLVTAEQISPDPTKAKQAVAAPPSNKRQDNDPIPGASPTLLERIFGS